MYFEHGGTSIGEWVFRADALNRYSNEKIDFILAPGFSVANGAYPALYALYDDLKDLPRFFPFGCSFQLPNFFSHGLEGFSYDERSLSFIKLISSVSGSYPCRDQLIVDLLQEREIPAHYFGDIALYRSSEIGKKIDFDGVKSIVFTIAHSPRYFDQMKSVIAALRRKFSHLKLYVAHHSVPTKHALQIERFAVEQNFQVLELWGNSENLSVYDSIDLHLGYRLHGHIYFLSRRKPSLLLAEDIRSYGFCKTPKTSACTHLAFDEQSRLPRSEGFTNEVIDSVSWQICKEFSSLNNVFEFIDKNYREVVSPYFASIVRSNI